MDTNNLRPTQGGESGVEAGNWRSKLQPDTRPRIINKILETLKRHFSISGDEGLSELRKMAVRFEDEIYTASTSHSDYLRNIALKMLTMETKFHTTTSMENPMSANSILLGNKQDSASQSLQPPVLKDNEETHGVMRE